MNYFYCLILLLIPLTLAYPRSHSNDLDRLLEIYLKERLENTNEIDDSSNSNEELFVRRQNLFPFQFMQQHQQVQPVCLPHIWTCGQGLPPCCPGLMCYDGNAKRGRQCVARG
jgi:hypothetical protein